MELPILLLAGTLSFSMAQGVFPIMLFSTEQVSKANNLFAVRMYKELAKTPGNVFFSPIGAHAVLSLIAQGASGETLNEFYKVLGVDQHTSANGYQGLMQYFTHLNLHIHMANKVYIQQNYRMKEKFKTVASYKFMAEAESINFADRKNAAFNINKWAMEKTHNKIKDITKLDDFDGQTRMMLLNAIYFQGNWLYKFNKTHTKKATFFVRENETYIADMMSTTCKLNYVENYELDAQILEMKYTSDDVSMVIILPKKRYGIGELERKLIGYNLSHIIHGMKKMKVHLNLPKFKIETKIELKRVLQQMGIVRAFGNADFSQLLELAAPLSISKAFQKAFIKVNEEGLEAAAASGLKVNRRSSPQILIQFVADHPFIIAVQANVQRWRNLLFLGKIVHPLNIN